MPKKQVEQSSTHFCASLNVLSAHYARTFLILQTLLELELWSSKTLELLNIPEIFISADREPIADYGDKKIIPRIQQMESL